MNYIRWFNTPLIKNAHGGMEGDREVNPAFSTIATSYLLLAINFWSQKAMPIVASTLTLSQIYQRLFIESWKSDQPNHRIIPRVTVRILFTVVTRWESNHGICTPFRNRNSHIMSTHNRQWRWSALFYRSIAWCCNGLRLKRATRTSIRGHLKTGLRNTWM